eukprot:2461100-Rhodomonas_salina.5
MALLLDPGDLLPRHVGFRHVLDGTRVSAICLHACYAMSGTVNSVVVFVFCDVALPGGRTRCSGSNWTRGGAQKGTSRPVLPLVAILAASCSAGRSSTSIGSSSTGSSTSVLSTYVAC